MSKTNQKKNKKQKHKQIQEMKLEPKESWSLVGGSSTHMSTIVHQKCHGKPHCQLQEEAASEQKLYAALPLT